VLRRLKVLLREGQRREERGERREERERERLEVFELRVCSSDCSRLCFLPSGGEEFIIAGFELRNENKQQGAAL